MEGIVYICLRPEHIASNRTINSNTHLWVLWLQFHSAWWGERRVVKIVTPQIPWYNSYFYLLFIFLFILPLILSHAAFLLLK